MKHFSLNIRWLIMSLLLCVGAGSAWGQTYTTVMELDLTTKSSGCSAYNTETAYGSWKIVYGANNNKGWTYFKMGGKKTTLSSANPCFIYNTDAASGKVDKITVHLPAGSLSKTGMSVNSWGVYVYSNSAMTTQIDYVSGGTITNSEGSFDFYPSPEKTWASGYYYKVSWDLANTTSTNGVVCVDKITLYKESNSTVATPTFSPAAGTYTEAQNVTISCMTSDANIYYRTDGSTPTTSSSVYSSAIPVTATTTIKAFAVKSGYTDSDVATATYTLELPTPTFSPSSGSFTESQNVTISSSVAGATIYYTTDGNDPTTSSSVYSSAIPVTETTTIKAIAVKNGIYSAIASAIFTINNGVAILPFEWNGGSSESLLAEDGVSQTGLGTDYAASNAPYQVKFDTTGDYILIHTDSQPGVVTIGVKMIGGANTSSINVQGSSDGTTFTDIETLSISGNQNDELTLATTNAFAENVRYVKLVFTKGSNVGVGPITISTPVLTTSIVAADVELTAEATSGEIAYTINNPITGTSLSASTTTSWISNVVVDAPNNKVTFTTTTNAGDTRTGTVTLTYGSITKDVTITQKKVVSYTEYTLASAIVSGKTYIFASGTDGEVKAMGEQTNNNRSAVSVTVENDKIQASDDAGVCEFVITAEGDNYTIFDGSGYLYAASSSKNYLKTETTLDENGNGLWSIVYNSDSEKGSFNIIAQGNYTHKVMQFNSGSSLFACYESDSQSPVYLFEKGTGTPMLSFAQKEVTTDYITNGSFTQAAICSNMGDPAPAINYTIESLDAGVDVADIAVLDRTTPGKVNFIAKGDVKITATTTYNEETYTATYTLHIVEPNIELFELVTSQDEIVADGEYLIVEKTLNSSAKAYNGQSGSNNYAGHTNVTISGIEIDNATPQAHVIKLENAGDGHWYLKDTADNCYLTGSSTNGSMSFVTTPTAYSKWNINVELVNTTIVNVENKTMQIKYNGTTSYNGTNFSNYSGVFTFVQLYKRATALSDAGISYDQNSFTINLGDAFTTPTLNNPNSVSPITFTSSNPNAVSVNPTTGAVTIKRSASATITATFAGNAAYKKAIATYVLNVCKVANEGLLFNETFDHILANGGNDGLFTGNVAQYYQRSAGWNDTKPGDSDTKWDDAWHTDEVWTLFDTDADNSSDNSFVQAGNQCVKFGAGSTSTATEGVMKTRSISMGEGVTQGTLSFSAAGWGTGDNYLKVSATGCTLTHLNHTGNSTVNSDSISLENGVWNDFNFSITNVTGDITITFRGWRGFLDEIAVGGPYTVTIGSTGYATLYYGSAPLVIPEGVTAYTLHTKDVNGYTDVELGKTLNQGDKIAAGTGVILTGAQGEYLFPFDFSNVEKNDNENILMGSDVATLFDESGYEYFVLGKKDGVVGFYHMTGTNGGKFVKNGAHKAFFRLPEGESILNDNTSSAAMRGGFSLEEMIATAIEHHEQEVKKDNIFYNLAGQRVLNPTKGIYIVNGKKVLIK